MVWYASAMSLTAACVPGSKRVTKSVMVSNVPQVEGKSSKLTKELMEQEGYAMDGVWGMRDFVIDKICQACRAWE